MPSQEELAEPAARWLPMPAFVSRREFRMAVLLAERNGHELLHYVGPSPVLVHPDSLRWLGEREALGRLREHFRALDREPLECGVVIPGVGSCELEPHDASTAHAHGAVRWSGPGATFGVVGQP